MKKILISRTDGIGDLMLTTPLIHEIKQNIEDSYIVVLAGKCAYEMLQNNPDVDDVIIYDHSDLKGMKEKILKEKIDIAIVAYPRFGICFALAECRIPKRIGTANRWYSMLAFTKMMRFHRKDSKHRESDYNLMLAESLIGKKTTEKVYYYVLDEEVNEAGEYLSKKGIGSEFLIVHPGSKGSAWNISEAQYVDLINEINDKMDIDVLLTGGPDEKKKINRIYEKVKNKSCLFAMEEQLSIRQFAAVISKSAVLISSSTGPMHIAAALNTKTLSFFPPDTITPMKPKRWGPVGNISSIIQPDESIKEPSLAMNAITAAYTVEMLKKLLEAEK